MSGTAWFARHELRLSWRDLQGTLTAGKPGRRRIAAAIVAVLMVAMHLIAWKIVAPSADVTFPPDRETLFMITGSGFLAWTVMISQAMESVTRAFYSRADLDLLLSSPAPTRTIFAFRVAGIGVSASSLALLLAGPFINALAVAGGPHWLCAYLVLLGLAGAATALAIGMTVVLFQLIGAKRTRLVAQIVAAVVGATFVIGAQAASIFAYGNLSRFDIFVSQWAIRLAPALDSPFWLPARAAMGDLAALAAVLMVCLGLFALAVSIASRKFGRFALAAASVGMGSVRQRPRAAFRIASAAAVLRRKEWTLLIRDPWLLSQTLMQVLYLIPPGMLLWRSYSEAAGGLAMLAPVLVMAGGQLAGGLAWLAISGEDAPDLVATAPVTGMALLRAKVEAVIAAVFVLMSPILLALAIASPWTAVVTMAGVLVAAGSATAIQIFFRVQAKRTQLRRRHTSSRVATFAEAFSSIGWAATAGLAIAGNALAALAAVLALLVLALAAMFRPRSGPAAGLADILRRNPTGPAVSADGVR